MNDSFRIGVVRGVSYGLFGDPDPFVEQAADLGATVVRVYVYWSQVEPEAGRFDFSVVDHLLAQLTGDGGRPELWLTVCSASPWATSVSTWSQIVFSASRSSVTAAVPPKNKVARPRKVATIPL